MELPTQFIRVTRQCCGPRWTLEGFSCELNPAVVLWWPYVWALIDFNILVWLLRGHFTARNDDHFEGQVDPLSLWIADLNFPCPSISRIMLRVYIPAQAVSVTIFEDIILHLLGCVKFFVVLARCIFEFYIHTFWQMPVYLFACIRHARAPRFSFVCREFKPLLYVRWSLDCLVRFLSDLIKVQIRIRLIRLLKR